MKRLVCAVVPLLFGCQSAKGGLLDLTEGEPAMRRARNVNCYSAGRELVGLVNAQVLLVEPGHVIVKDELGKQRFEVTGDCVIRFGGPQ